MLKETTMTEHTSPLTGVTYGIEPKVTRRVTRFEDGQPVWEEQTQWDVLLDGKLVQFSLTEEGLLDAIALADGVTDGVEGSRFD